MYLYGACGHGKVIIDILELCNVKVEGLFDDNSAIHELAGYPVRTFSLGEQHKPLIISIGNNYERKKISEMVSGSYGKAIHPSAIISNGSSIDDGSVVMANVSINANVQIGKHCIVNTGSSIDHDCTLEDYVHISPGAILCGNVSIQEGTHLGAGAVVIPGVTIGKWCVIGAGAVVIRDIPDNSVAVGNPCQVIKTSVPNS